MSTAALRCIPIGRSERTQVYIVQALGAFTACL